MKKYNGKTYQGKLAAVTIIRHQPPVRFIEEIKKEHPDILNVGPYLFFLSAVEAHPVKRRFSLLSKFQSSYLTAINRQEGEVAALRKWWKVLTGPGGMLKSGRVEKNLSEIDLAGENGWEPMDVPKDQWPHDYIDW